MAATDPRIPLGELTRVPLRDAWPDEAADFSPWLAQPDNLELLGGVIGLDLEAESLEEGVGDFRADIVARDGDTVVVVENQFGRTNHDHLGKLLVYAAGLQATVVVWIAEQLRPEHRQALDWLNEYTPEGVDFFGLELELWRVGESPAAPKFNVVSAPNDWARAVRASSAVDSPRKAEQVAFWQGFSAHVEDAGLPLRLAPHSGRWYRNVRLGRTGYILSLQRIVRRGQIACDFRINHPSATQAYDLLEGKREDIERLTGPLEWKRLPEKRVSRIVARRPADLSDRANWPEIYAWLGETAVAFQQAFQESLQDLDDLPEADPDEAEDDAPR